MKTCLRYSFICAVLFLSSAALAQVSTGTPPLGSFSSGPDVMNLGNLNVHFAIPVFRKPGRGVPFFYNLGYDSSIWSPTSSSGTASWTPVANWGWRGETDAAVGYVTLTTWTSTCRSDDGTTQPYTIYDFDTYVDQFGTTHVINGRTDTKDQANCISGTGTQQTTATDASGMTFVLTNDPDATVIMADGSVFHPSFAIGPQPGTITDRNGNQITTSGATFVDTLGMTALSDSGAAPNPKTFTYTDSGGTGRSVTVNYAPYTVQTNFGCSGISEYGPTSVSLVNNVTLPDGSSYSFQYESTLGAPANVTGRIKSITLPTGGSITYAYSGGNNGIECADGSTAGLSRTTMDGTTSYSRTGSGTAWTTTILDAMPTPNTTIINFQTAGTNFYETHRTVNQGASNILLQTDTCYNAAAEPNCSTTAITLPITEIKSYTILPNSQQSLRDVKISGPVPTEVDEYDFGSAPQGSLLRKTLYSYAALGNGIGAMPANILIYDAGNNLKAQTTYGYDETAVTATSGVPQHVAITGSRGNLTSLTQWVSSTASSLVSQFTYDDTGNMITSTDSSGNQTQYSYADNFRDAINRTSLAYLTQVTLPNTGVSHVSKTQYDPNTGLPMAAWDLNNNQTSFTYDSMLRPLVANYPNGGQISLSYSPTTIAKSAKLNSTQTVSTELVLDGLARVTQQQLTSDPAGVSTIDTLYNPNGLVASISNPHRSTSASTDGVSHFSYDALGRILSVTEQDGSIGQQSYSGNQVTITDESGVQHKNIVDALGRLTTVWEPDPANGSTFLYETDYQYDVLDNLVRVDQKGNTTDTTQWRTRTYSYDGVPRLTQSTTPEQGSTTIAYVNAGGARCSGNPFSPCQQTDARGVVTTFSYDALNRLIQKSYSDGTASAVLSYDQTSAWGAALGNTNGQLTQITTSPFTSGSTFSYDAMGNITQQWECTPTNCGQSSYAMAAQYDLAGDLTSLQYPSGRVVTYGYNAASTMNSVQFTQYNGTAPSGGAYTYWSAADANFYPTGMPQSATLGNGVTDTLTANSRLQPSQMTVSNSQLGNFANHAFTYQATPANNGNIYSVADQLNSGLTQSFTYDKLNRLLTATESRWGLSFGYDAWGNFLQQNLTSGTAGTRSDIANTLNQLTGRSYDLSGNTTNDGAHSYAYDAENHITTVDSGAATYSYDGIGARVRKTVSGQNTEYIYFAGQTIATRASDGKWTDYIFGPQGRIARAQDYDNGLRVYGTRCANCGSQYSDYYFANAGGLKGYVIRSGDKLYFTQYQLTGSHGGVLMAFSDGTNSNWSVKDKEGYYLNDDQSQSTTHFRTIDLTPFAGKTVNQFAANQESDTASGDFAIIYEQMVLVSTDGTVHPIYTGQTSSPVSSISGTTGVTGRGSQIDVNTGHAIYPQQTTVYFSKDQLSSSTLLTSGLGYPIWGATFLPYGQEYNPELGGDNFKFTGLEHDGESGLDHAWFRSNSGAMGRWSSPDPDPASTDLTHPQSLNRYSYVINNPINLIDPLGLVCSGNIGNFSDTVCNPANDGGGGGSGMFADGGDSFSFTTWTQQPSGYVDGEFGEPGEWTYGYDVTTYIFTGFGTGGSNPGGGTAANKGKCLSNVRTFVNAHLQDAQTLAISLGNGVTPAEVLAVAGNETHYGDPQTFARFGNFFGLHGSGPAGTYYTTGNQTPVAKFLPGTNGFLLSGQRFVSNVGPYMQPGMGTSPLQFFTILNQHGYATGNPGYPAFMVNTSPNNRGPYALVSACI